MSRFFAGIIIFSLFAGLAPASKLPFSRNLLQLVDVSMNEAREINVINANGALGAVGLAAEVPAPAPAPGPLSPRSTSYGGGRRLLQDLPTLVRVSQNSADTINVLKLAGLVPVPAPAPAPLKAAN